MDKNIYDTEGRHVAGPQPPETAAFEAHVESHNRAAITVNATVCAWCPGFDPRDEKNRGVSHGICKSCQEKMDRQMEERDAKSKA